jgi:hypothetical protein
LMGFTLAYLLLLLLGQDPLAEKLRPYFEQPRRTARHGTQKILSCPLDGYLLTLGPALGTTGNRTLVANSLPAGSWPRGRYAFFLLALRKLTRFENIPCVYLLTGPRSSLTTVISAKLPGLLRLRSSQSLLEIFANSHHTKNETCQSPGPSEEILDPRSVPREAPWQAVVSLDRSPPSCLRCRDNLDALRTSSVTTEDEQFQVDS